MFQGDGLHKGKYNRETELGRDPEFETSSVQPGFLNVGDEDVSKKWASQRKIQQRNRIRQRSKI